MRKIFVALLLVASAFATNYTVKSGGGGSFTTMAACATAQSSSGGDICTVYAGTYNENVTVKAGTVGNYNVFNVNGSDVVTVLSFTLNSHTKLIGNCTAPAAINTCGFNIQNPSSPGAASCVTTTAGTDIYIVNNVMYACANGLGSSGSTGGAAIYVPSGASFIYIQGDTISYPAATSGNPVFTGKGIDFGELTAGVDNVLVENCDFSHYTLGVKFISRHSVFRNNTFHDQLESEGSSNAHTDIFFSEQSSNVQYNVIEGNFERHAVGPNAKGVLAQGNAPCTGCTNLIVRYDVTSRIGSGVSSNYGTWPNIKLYNNTHVDLNMEGASSGQDTDYNDSSLTSVGLLNTIYYYNTPSAWSNWNSGSCGSSCVAGHNLYWCVGAGCSTPYNHIYGGSGGNWTADAGNLHADPKFANYVSPGSASNDYHLLAGSPAIAAGTYLTTVAAGDSGSGTSLVVTDAAYFQDGYSLTNANSTVSGDCISVTTVGNHVCITAVNYSTNTLTLASGFSRSSGDHIWLYSKSDGTKVLTGSAPDLGALPYQSPSASIPIVYYARTDVTAQPYPVTIPCPGPSCGSALGTLTGANHQFTPTDFPTPYVRITDGSTPATNNLGFTTAGSASSEVNLWGPDSDFFIITQKGGFSDIFKFNTTTNTATYVASSNTIGSTTEASHIPHSHIVYAIKPCPAATTGCSQYDLVIWQYDLTGLTGWPTPTIVADLTTACGFTSYSGAAFIADPSTSLDDQTFSTAVCTSGTCAQDQAGAQYAVSWNRTNGCSYLNTLTDQVYDNGTLLGAVSGLSGAFTLHNARGSGDGQHVRMTPTVSYGFNQLQVWQPFTLNGTFSNSGDSCGHVCSGTLHIFNKCTGTYLNGMGEMPFSNLSAWTSLAAIYPSPDQADSAHITCASMNSTDTNPFALIMAMPTATYPTYAWDNELLAQATDGTGRTWRFGHTFSTVALQNLLPAAISQDGKYLLWQSDWMDMFGCTNGTSVGCGVLEPDWATGAYTTASRITPLTGNAGGYTYQPTGSCTASGSQPAWTQTIGSTSADSGCTWTNIGQARTDVMLAILPTQQNPNPATNLMVKVGQIETKALLGGSE